MGKLTRKNLVLDDVKVKELAKRLGTSESEPVREAVDRELAVAELGEALHQLQASSGIRDVFHEVPLERKRKWRREARSRIRRFSSP
ncbi:MAG: hypothetical protein HYY04_16515 [Chloroflexi bacterium]|nr:hypothetical protein [Chloroflexota bacterium]